MDLVALGKKIADRIVSVSGLICDRHGAHRMSQFTRSAAISFLFVSALTAADFSIQFASPVAAQSYRMKQSAFVFRTLGCLEEAKLDVSATAEGLVNGQRRSMALKVAPAPTPAVYGIFREWPNEGLWVVNITARCGAQSAGAIVTTNDKGFVRETSKTLDHAASRDEIETTLKAGKKTEGRID
jgi:hypothetical protein